MGTRPTRPIFTFPYGPGFHSLWYSVLHYDAVVRHFGVRNWLRDEVFPLSLKGSGGGQWLHQWHERDHRDGQPAAGEWV